MTKRVFQVRGEARVMFTTLPPGVDLAVAFPTRLLVTRSETRTVWMAKPGRYALLIVGERTPENRRGLLLVMAFELDSASLAVFADVTKRLITATVQDKARRLAEEQDEWDEHKRWRRPLPPCPCPTPIPDEPVYEILPVPPVIPVPEPKTSQRRYKSLPHGAGESSGAEIY